MPHSSEVYIQRIIDVMDSGIKFVCQFEGQSVFYNLPIADKDVVPKVAEVLRGNRDKTLLENGLIQIPEN